MNKEYNETKPQNITYRENIFSKQIGKGKMKAEKL